MDLTYLLFGVRHAIFAAGQEILRIKREGFETGRKAGYELVTAADPASGRVLRYILGLYAPDVPFVSEELGGSSHGIHWLADDLDSTASFAAGSPEYSVTVALIRDGRPIVGATYQPDLGLLWNAAQGLGAFLGVKRISSSACSSLDQAVFVTSESHMKKPGYDEFMSRFPQVSIEMHGSPALRAAKVADGTYDACFFPSTSRWGVAAGDLLVQEAGGKFTTLDGSLVMYDIEDRYVGPILAANPILHDKLL